MNLDHKFTNQTPGGTHKEHHDESMDAFVSALFKEPTLFGKAYAKGRLQEPRMTMLSIAPGQIDVDYATRAAMNEPRSFGQYSVNPDLEGVDYAKLEKPPQAVLLPLKELAHPDYSIQEEASLTPEQEEAGAKRFEVVKHIVAEYGTRYRLPDLGYLKFLSDNPDKVPEELKQPGKWFYFMGSAFPDSKGILYFPCVYWDEEQGKLIPAMHYAQWPWGKSLYKYDKQQKEDCAVLLDMKG